MEVVWLNEQNLFPAFSGGRLAGFRNAVPGSRFHSTAASGRPVRHADDKGGLPEDSTSSSQKGAKDADKATSISQQRKQSVEAIEKLLKKRLFKNAAEQALKQLDEYDDQYSGATFFFITRL